MNTFSTLALALALGTNAAALQAQSLGTTTGGPLTGGPMSNTPSIGVPPPGTPTTGGPITNAPPPTRNSVSDARLPTEPVLVDPAPDTTEPRTGTIPNENYGNTLQPTVPTIPDDALEPRTSSLTEIPQTTPRLTDKPDVLTPDDGAVVSNMAGPTGPDGT